MDTIREIINSEYIHIPGTTQFTSRAEDFKVVIGSMFDYLPNFYNQKIVFFDDHILIVVFNRIIRLHYRQITRWTLMQNKFSIFTKEDAIVVQSSNEECLQSLLYTLETRVIFLMINEGQIPSYDEGLYLLSILTTLDD